MLRSSVTPQENNTNNVCYVNNNGNANNNNAKKPCTFILPERGHLRKIDAPHIEDRQVHKAICRYVLRPLYYPHLIYDNGASMEGKGFAFAINRILYFLRRWYRRFPVIAYDWEYDSDSYAAKCGVSMTNDKRYQFAVAFLKRVKERGYTPIIYVNYDYLNKGFGTKEL